MRVRSLLAATLVSATGLTAVATTTANASWANTGAGAAAAQADVLRYPTKVTVAPTSPTGVTITSTAPRSGPTPTSYQTDRTSSTAATVCATANPCSDTRTAGALVAYKVASKLGGWTSATTTTPPTVSITMPSTGATFFPTLLSFTNGSGTANKPDAGDVISITMSAAPTTSSICNVTWGANNVLTGVTITMSPGNGHGTNDITFSRSGCPATFLGKFTGTTNAFIAGNNTASWSGTLQLTNSVLTVTLGACTASAPDCNAVGVGAADQAYTYAPDTGMRSAAAATPSGTSGATGDLF